MKETASPKIIIAMPAYNEEKYIGSIVLQAQEYTSKVIVVDDGSTDRTAKIAKLAGATVIQHGENRGYGAAVQSILSEVKKNPLDILVLLDADSQHNPDEIPILTKAISEGYDLAIGSRKVHRENIPKFRRVGQGILSFLTRILSKSKLSDTESGFRAFSRKAITILELQEKGMAISAETISEATAKGLRVTEVPISATYVKDSSTLNPIRHGLGVLHRVIVMISERRPLLFFGLCGSVLITLGIIAGIIVVQVLYDREVLQVGTALISMLLVTVGILSIFIGIILDVIVRRMK